MKKGERTSGGEGACDQQSAKEKILKCERKLNSKREYKKNPVGEKETKGGRKGVCRGGSVGARGPGAQDSYSRPVPGESSSNHLKRAEPSPRRRSRHSRAPSPTCLPYPGH